MTTRGATDVQGCRRRVASGPLTRTSNGQGAQVPSSQNKNQGRRQAVQGGEVGKATTMVKKAFLLRIKCERRTLTCRRYGTTRPCLIFVEHANSFSKMRQNILVHDFPTSLRPIWDIEGLLLVIEDD